METFIQENSITNEEDSKNLKDNRKRIENLKKDEIYV